MQIFHRNIVDRKVAIVQVVNNCRNHPQLYKLSANVQKVTWMVRTHHAQMLTGQWFRTFHDQSLFPSLSHHHACLFWIIIPLMDDERPFPWCWSRPPHCIWRLFLKSKRRCPALVSLPDTGMEASIPKATSGSTFYRKYSNTSRQNCRTERLWSDTCRTRTSDVSWNL